MELAKGEKKENCPSSPEEAFSMARALAICELEGYVFIFPAAHKW